MNVEGDGGRTALISATRNGFESIVETLVKAGADLNKKDVYYRYTPLVWAVIENKESIVEILVKAGANLNAKDVSGRTALFWAVEKNQEIVVKILVEAGADLNVKKKIGDSPLIFAAKNGFESIVKILVEALWIDLKAKDLNAKDLNAIDLNAKDVYGRTALILAARNGYESIVKMLVEAGADSNVKDDNGRTALMVAMSNKHVEIVDVLSRIDFDDDDDEYPLHCCCPISHKRMRDPVIAESGYTYERLYILKWLKEKGRDPITQSRVSTKLIQNRALKDAIELEVSRRSRSLVEFPRCLWNPASNLFRQTQCFCMLKKHL